MFKRAPILRMVALSVLVAVLALGMGASAQQPGAVNPTASAASEEQLLRQLQSVEGRITIPDARAGVLIQPAGRDWRLFHESTLPWIGGVAILGILVLVFGFYAVRGRIRIEAGPSGRRIERFNGFERFVHWLTAGCFVILALTGLNITFGKWLLLPWMGPEAFTALSQWGKYAHNYLAFPFMLGLLFTLVVWIKENLPDRSDLVWLREGGGILGKGHPPAKKFNAGQKVIYWSVIVGGIVLSVSGLLLLFPFSGTTVGEMQLSQMVHAIAGVVLIAIMIAHIYIGTLGMEGAFDAMGTGQVDLNWAKEHHSLWVAEAQSRDQATTGKAAGAPAE
jgi:formate dehydrogenase subunit gamma